MTLIRCEFEPFGKLRCKCRLCGRIVRNPHCDVRAICLSNPEDEADAAMEEFYQKRLARRGPPKVVGLGDYTERLLASIGATPERYAAAKERFGLAPTCGCEARKAWLNDVGRWLTG